MKILIVLYYYHPYVSGLSVLAKMEAEGLAARGHEVTVLAMRHRDDLPEAETVNGVRVVRAAVLTRIGKGAVSLDFLHKAVRLARAHDIVNPHLPMAHFGLILPFIDRRRLVAQYHCDLNLGNGVLAGLIERFSYWSMGKTLERSSRIVATTREYFAGCRFASHLGKVRQIYPPIDQSRFINKDSSALKARLGIEGNPRLIGFVGRIVAEKGLEYLLQAIPYIEAQTNDFQVLIAGDYVSVAGGSVKDRIDVLIAQFPGRVRFLGHLAFDDLVAFYNLIDVLVLPSVDPLEAFGMVQVEAMLCGTPVVASDMPGVREVVARTGFGRLARRGDPEDIAAKLLDLLAHPVTVERAGLADFTFERSIAGYEALFAAVSGGGA